MTQAIPAKFAGACRWGASILLLLAVCGVLAPTAALGQDPGPQGFDIESAGTWGCYVVDVFSLDDLNIQLRYSFNGGSNLIINWFSWPGQSTGVEVCQPFSQGAGEYYLDAIRNGSNGSWYMIDTTVDVSRPPSFTLAGAPSSQTVTQGETATYSISVSPENGFDSTVSLSVSVSGPGTLSATVTPTTLASPYTSTTLTAPTTSTTPLGTYTITVTGSGGGESDSVTVTLIVNEPPTFTLDAAPDSRSVDPGGEATYSISVSPENGFISDVTLDVSGEPAGVNASFSSDTLSSPYSSPSTLSVPTAASTTPGTYTLTVAGSGGGESDSVTVTLIVDPPPETFTLDADPSSQTVTQGETAAYAISVLPENGFDSDVTLSVTQPAGISGATVIPTPLSSPYDSSSMLTVPTTASTTPGTYTITVDGSGGGEDDDVTVTLIVNEAPGFTLDADLSSQTVFQSETATYAISVSEDSGFDSDVGLSVSESNLPSDVTVSFSSDTLSSPYNSSSTLRVTTTSATTPGTYTITVDGMGGGQSDDETVTLTVVRSEFNLYADIYLRRVDPGGAATYSISVLPDPGFASPVGLSLSESESNLPSDVTVSFSSDTLSSPYNSSSTLRVTTTASTTPGTYTITVDGMGGGVSKTDWVTLIVEKPDFTLSAAPASRTVDPGGAATYSISVLPVHGFASPVGLSLSESESNLPSDVTVSFIPATLSSPYNSSSTLRVTTTASTTPGTYTITVDGMGGGMSKTDWVTLTVEKPDFTLSAAPASRTVDPGGEATYSISVLPVHGFASPVGLSLSESESNLPSEVTVSFSSDTLSSPYNSSSTLRVTTTASTTPGTYTITVDGMGGGMSKTDWVTLTVEKPDFTLSAAPASRSVDPGGTATYSISVLPVHGFASPVGLTVSGLPAGVTESSFIPATLSSPYNSSSTLRVPTTASTTPGTYTITVTGMGGGEDDDVTVTLTVENPDFTLDADPASRSVDPGGEATYRISVLPVHTFASPVDLSVSGLPTGWSATVIPATLSSPYMSASTLTVSTAAAAAPGPYTITVTGMGGGEDDDLLVTVRVNGPDFTLAVDPASRSVGPGGAATYAISVLPLNDFDLDVGLRLSESNLPFDVTVSFIAGTLSSPYMSASTLTVTTTASTTPGTYEFTVEGTGGVLSRTGSVTLIVEPPTFTLDADPASRSVDPGGEASYAISVLPVHGFASPVDLMVSGLPAGVMAEFSSDTLYSPYDAPSTLRVTTTTPGTYSFKVEGTAGALSDDATVTLTVGDPDPDPDFTLAGAPSSQTVGPGGAATYAISVLPVHGFDRDVWLSVVNDLPEGVTAEFDPEVLEFPYAAPSTLRVTTDGASPGTLSVAITGSLSPFGPTRPASVDLVVVAQPTSFSFNPSLSYAGRDTTTLTVGNGANMRLDLDYTLDYTYDNTGPVQQQRTILLDSNGQWQYSPHRDDWAGTYTYTRMKNALLEDWVPIDPEETYTVAQAQPTWMTVTPSSIVPPADFTFRVGNGAFVTLDVRYTLTPPGAAAGSHEITGWPRLGVVPTPFGNTTIGIDVISASGCTLPGDYLYTEMKNTWHNDALWVDLDVPLALRSPVSVTSVAPAAIPLGTSATVTIAGEHLCALTLSTAHPGVTISNVAFDPVQGDGTTATALVAVDAAAPPGLATVNVSAGQGSTTFILNIGSVPPPPMRFEITPTSIFPGGCYTIDVGTPNIALDVQYSFNGGPTLTRENWGSVGPDGTSLVCTQTNLPVGTYEVTAVRNAAGGDWLEVSATSIVMPPPPMRFEITPTAIFLPGGCYTVDVGTPNIALDVQYSFNGGPTLTIENWGSVGYDGTALVCPAADLPLGTYEVTAVRNAAGGDWLEVSATSIAYGGATLTLSAPSTQVNETGDPGPDAPANAGARVEVTVQVVPALPSGAEYTGCNVRAVEDGTTAGLDDYAIDAQDRAIRAVDAWTQTFVFWALKDTVDEEEETLVLEAFCAGEDANAPPPVLAADLATTQLAFTIEDATPGLTREYVYLGGRVIAVESP